MPEQTNSIYVGIDVAKASLEVASWPAGLCLSLRNSPEGFAKLVSALQRHDVKLVVMEATGGYERSLAGHLVGAGFPTVVINPRRVRRYADALDEHAKTDTIDALVIARFAEAIKPVPRPAPTPQTEQLAEFVGRRAQLVKIRVQETNHLESARDKAVRKDIQRMIRAIDKQIAHIDALIAERISSDDDFSSTDQILRSVKGIGSQTSAMLIARLPELGRMNRQQIAALVGVAPWARKSGNWTGNYQIWAGRADVRAALYMPTVTAMRDNPDIRAFAGRLTGSGKAFKVVMTACMRKLLVILNTMVRNNTKWQSRILPN